MICLLNYGFVPHVGHYCLVFENLAMSLLDLIKMNNYKRLPLDVVRDVSQQLLEAMRFLKSMNLIHTGNYLIAVYCIVNKIV